ncbi:MAG: tyrosine-type recombinase/integrase, partial [Desulfobacteria bacterium]
YKARQGGISKPALLCRDYLMIRLPKEIVKEKKDKHIPMNHHVKDAIDAELQALHHEFVITYRGKPMNGKNSLKKQFGETCEKANIPYGRKTNDGITFHDMRRTVKTNMVAAGVDKVYRDTILGHSLKGMDVYYIVPKDDALTNAMTKYTEWFDHQVKVVSANVDQSVDQVGLKK